MDARKVSVRSTDRQWSWFSHRYPPAMASSFHRLRPKSAVPTAEARNYGQRVMENLRVYRARFGAGSAMVEPNRHRAATVESRA